LEEASVGFWPRGEVIAALLLRDWERAAFAGGALTDRTGALRTTIVLVDGLIVARTRFFVSGVAALAPWVKSKTNNASGKMRSQDMLCTLRSTYAS
jgi:hypothetical protein